MPTLPFKLPGGVNKALFGSKLNPLNMAMKPFAERHLMSGIRGGAGTGAGIGGVAGGLHGAFTDDPNNPNESRLGRIATHALGGAALGAGAGGIAGGAKAQMGNMYARGVVHGGVGGGALGYAAGAGHLSPDALKGAYNKFRTGGVEGVMSNLKPHYDNFMSKVSPGIQGYMGKAKGFFSGAGGAAAAPAGGMDSWRRRGQKIEDMLKTHRGSGVINQGGAASGEAAALGNMQAAAKSTARRTAPATEQAARAKSIIRARDKSTAQAASQPRAQAKQQAMASAAQAKQQAQSQAKAEGWNFEGGAAPTTYDQWASQAAAPATKPGLAQSMMNRFKPAPVGAPIDTEALQWNLGNKAASTNFWTGFMQRSLGDK